MKTKDRIREEALALRRQMSQQERTARSEAVAERFLSLDLLHPGSTVCFYLSTWDEVETRPLVTKALRVGCRVVLPRVSPRGELELFPVDDLSGQVEVGSFGIEEPVRSFTASMPPEMVDCFVVPGVAFDTSGRRCGFGLGYFDQLLALRAPKALVVALAFECQIKPVLPAEEHDVLMDFICIEERTLDCPRQSDRTRAVHKPAIGEEVKNT